MRRFLHDAPPGSSAPFVMADRPTIIFAGGGTGGHIYPNLAVVERLRRDGVAFDPHFFVSSRPLDARIVQACGISATPLAITPPGPRPWAWPRDFYRGVSAIRAARRVIVATRACGLVATGGFVSVAAVMAASRCGVPVAVVNLDAVPGRANRLLARPAKHVFSAYPWPEVVGVESIGVPLRQEAVDTGTPAAARRALGLDPQRDTLLIVGGSQGAQTLNALGPPLARALGPHVSRWQWLHLTGGQGDVEAVSRAYAAEGVTARVLAFSNAMGTVWSAATVAITRAGAGSVAEAWANAVPCLFLPYPYHRDQHQKLNAGPMVACGGAILIDDLIDVDRNVSSVGRALNPVLSDRRTLRRMGEVLAASRPADGAMAVARWVQRQAGQNPG